MKIPQCLLYTGISDKCVIKSKLQEKIIDANVIAGQDKFII